MTYTYVVTEVNELLQQWRTKWHTLVREDKARRNAGNRLNRGTKVKD